MTLYADELASVAADLTAAGGAVTFHRNASTYDETTDTFTGPVTTDAATVGLAKRPSSAERARYEKNGYVLGATVTLLVPASGLAITPQAGDTLTWGGMVYTVREVGIVQPDGTALLYELVATR